MPTVSTRRMALSCVLLIAASAAAFPRDANPKSGVPAQGGQFRVEDLAWMSGDWQTSQGGAQIEEHWTGVAGGTMIGMGRTVVEGKTVFFEYLRIETRADAIYYVAHPKARAGTDFKLVRLDGQTAVFENLAHDFPKRIIYRKSTEDALTARIEGDGSEREKPQEFHYGRMR